MQISVERVLAVPVGGGKGRIGARYKRRVGQIRVSKWAMPEYRTHGEPLAIATGCEVACNIPIGEHAHGVYCVLVYDCGPALESTTFVWTVGPTPSSSLYVVPAQPDVDVSRYVGVGWGRRRCRGTGKWWTRHRRAASIPRRAFKPWMAPVRCVTDTPRTTARRRIVL